jgi:hypothetical protein
MPKFTVSVVFNVKTDDEEATPDKIAEIIKRVLSDAAANNSTLALTANNDKIVATSAFPVVSALSQNK